MARDLLAAGDGKLSLVISKLGAPAEPVKGFLGLAEPQKGSWSVC